MDLRDGDDQRLSVLQELAHQVRCWHPICSRTDQDDLWVASARERGVLQAQPMFTRLTADGVAWADGTALACDAVIWCTGFRPALRHLRPLGLRTHGGRIPVGGPSGAQALEEPRLHLVGYGDWTGPASATLAGVGPSARAVARELSGR